VVGVPCTVELLVSAVVPVGKHNLWRVRNNLCVSSAAPVASANALSGAACNEGDACPIVLVRGLELHRPQLTYAAQHHGQNEAVKPTGLCTAMCKMYPFKNIIKEGFVCIAEEQP